MADTKISALGAATLPLSATDTFAVVQSMGTTPVTKRVAFSDLQISLTSGTYVPTLYDTTNVASSTAYQCQYMRVGNVVTVSGGVAIDTTAATTTVLGMSIPIASNFGATYDCAGVATQGGTALTGEVASIQGDAANDRAMINYKSVDTGASYWMFTFTYRVI